MTTRLERREPGATTTGRSSSNLRGTWTIDPAHSSIAFTWRALRLWTVTGRRHCLGVIHLDELPPIGVIRFQQPSGLPVLTMALDPASLETRDPDLNAMLSGPDFGAVRRQRWWTLHSQSLEVLPSGAWRVMAALIAHGSQGLVELRLEIDPEQSRSDWLVLRGGECWIAGPSASVGGPHVSSEAEPQVDSGVASMGGSGPSRSIFREAVGS